MSKSEQQEDELVGPDQLFKVFGIPRGSASALIKNKNFPKPLRVVGAKTRYYLASQVRAWMETADYIRRPRKKKSTKTAALPKLVTPTRKAAVSLRQYLSTPADWIKWRYCEN